MDSVHIRGLKAEAVIGVHEWERRLPRTLLVDLELAVDVARAAAHDRLADALDYQAVSDTVLAFIGASRCQLVETLAEQLAARLRAEFQVPWLRLTIHKPGAVAAAQDIAISVERGSRR